MEMKARQKQLQTIVHHVGVLIFLLLFTSLAFAQKSTIDSLALELEIHSKRDTLRVNLLNEISLEYSKVNLEKAKQYLSESEAISAKINYKKGKAKGVFIKGLIEARQSNFDQSIAFLKESLEMNKSIDCKSGVSESSRGLGMVYYQSGDYKKSINYFKKAVAILEEIGNKDEIPNCLNNIGSGYLDMGNYKEALSYYNRALKLNQALNELGGVSRSYNNLGILYDDQGNYPLALEYYNKSLVISERIKDSVGIANTTNNIGIIYKYYGNFDKAIEYYRKSLAIHQAAGNKSRVALVLNNLGIIYKRKGDYKKALELYESALKISREFKDKDNTSACLNSIGDVYLELKDYTKALQKYQDATEINIEIGDKRGLCNSFFGTAAVYTCQKNYQQALAFALKSKALADEGNLLNFKRDLAELLSEIYKKTGKYNLALASYEEFKLLSDSLFNKQNIEKITQLEYEYKYQGRLESARNRELKLTNKVAVTNKDLEISQRNYLLAIIGFLSLTMILGSLIFYLRFRNIKSKTQTILMEQKLLRSQMTPHFIFNSLSVLQGMILNKEEKKSVSYLSKFSKLLRIILENSRDKTVSLEQELAAVENYLALQNLENEAYAYSVSVEENVDVNKFVVPPMLIQPFVENAIEHAFLVENENKRIEVRLAYRDKNLICTITDNGIGIDTQKVKKDRNKTSLSTTITNERLKTLSKEFKIKGSLTVEDRRKYNESGTVVKIIIPYKTTEDR